MTNARGTRITRDGAAELRAETAREEARHRAVAIAVAVVTGVLVLVSAGIIVQSNRQESIDTSLDRTPPDNLVNGAFLVGKTDAPVTITNYSDYICPFCGLTHQANKEQLATWVAEGTVKVEYRMISFLDQASTDDYSTRALNLVAAVMDTEPDAFVAVHDALYAQQPEEGGAGLPDEKLIEIAVAAGAPETEIRRAVGELTFEGWIRVVTEDASKNGIRATPTVLVNGQQVESAADPDQLSSAVEQALRQQ